MKKLSVLTMAAVFAVLFVMPYCFGVSTGQTKSVTLNYANFPPAPTFPCVQMERWKKQVEKKTNGRIKINTFPGGTLLGAKGMMDGVIAGQADIGCLCMAYQPGRFTVTNAVSLPLGIPDSETGSLVLLDLYKKYKPVSFNKVKVLTMFTSAPASIMCKKPVRTLADIKDVDLRASGGAAAILRIWGANQIGMPMSATPEALQKGVVQGLFSSLEVMKDLKFAEDCKFVTMTNTVVYPFAVVMNLNTWKSLPENTKNIMDNLAEDQAQWTGNYMDSHVKDAIAWSKKVHRVEFIKLDKKSAAKWNSVLSPIVEKWIVKADKKGFKGKEIVSSIKTMIAEHTK